MNAGQKHVWQKRTGPRTPVMDWPSPKMDAWSPSPRKSWLARLSSHRILTRVIEYTQYSSVHGLRYIGDITLHPFERAFWLMAFLLAIAASSIFISNLFVKIDLMPVIMSLSPQSSTIKDIPFPAITICNMNSMRRTEAQRILNSDFQEADVDQKLIYDFCDSTNVTLSPEDQNITADWEYIKKFMVKMSQPCHEMLVLCKWHGDPLSCNDLFNPSLTDEGMCCVFNRLNREFIFQNPRDESDLNVTFPFEAVDWSPERGFPANTPPDNLPRRPRGSGTHLGLTLVVDAELTEYFCSSENGKGFKVLLNNPIETPKVSSFGISIPPGQETKMVILPHSMTASAELVNIDLSKRKCFFENERRLAFYRTYTQRSCMLECEANFTLSFCGCVQYYMPKNKHTRICGRTDRICALDAQKMMELSMNDAMTNFTFNTNKKLILCRCLPGCYELSYSFIISSVPITERLTMKPNFQGDKDFNYFKQNMAIIHIFFMEKHFSGTVRGVLYGITELLSNAGGLLGLFMGFSFMSAVELVYFLTLRVWFHINKKENPQKSSQKTYDTSNIRMSTIFTKSNLPFNK